MASGLGPAGHWDIVGSIHINQVIDNIPITCVDKPSGNAEAHHIGTVGGTFNGQNWRMKTAEVMQTTLLSLQPSCLQIDAAGTGL